MLPAAIAAPGDDGNYGSAATLDVLALQALSKRIHYGKFVAEAKFRWALQLKTSPGPTELQTHHATTCVHTCKVHCGPPAAAQQRRAPAVDRHMFTQSHRRAACADPYYRCTCPLSTCTDVFVNIRQVLENQHAKQVQ
jgi:hypothetical protein